IGVLSDRFNALGGASADEANGNLTSTVQVLKDLPSGTDEGRAMLQVAHDVAPSAQLAFYTAGGKEQDFAQGGHFLESMLPSTPSKIVFPQTARWGNGPRLGQVKPLAHYGAMDGALARGFTNAWRSSLKTDGVNGVGHVRSKHR